MIKTIVLQRNGENYSLGIGGEADITPEFQQAL